MKAGLIFPVGGGGGVVVPAMVLVVTRASGPPPCVRVLLGLRVSFWRSLQLYGKDKVRVEFMTGAKLRTRLIGRNGVHASVECPA
jgi:hypothetical protein